VELVPSQLETVRRVGALEDLRRRAVLAQPIAHRDGGVVRLLAASGDRVEVEVESAGGVFVLRRAYHPLLVARSGKHRLESFPANVALTAVAVPPGRHRVVLEVSDAPELAGGAVALIALGACIFAARRPGDRRV
jgi:hypothetical protein